MAKKRSGDPPEIHWPEDVVAEGLKAKARIKADQQFLRDLADPPFMEGTNTTFQNEVVGAENVEPRKLLTGWHDICLAVDFDYDRKREIASLNSRFNGPIVNEGTGTKPLVYRDALIDWWNRLALQQQELANKQKGARLSAESRHDYGRDGSAAPEVGGSIKKRRRDST